MLEINVPGGSPEKPGFSVQRSGNGLSIGAGTLCPFTTVFGIGTMFGIAQDEGGLSVSAFPVEPAPTSGWTIYTFRRNGIFRIGYGAVTADVLLIGGGGSGGGGYQGGGGGGGGFVDVHGFTVDQESQGDGSVIVGAAGARVPFRHPHGHNGGESTFGPLIAYGGGYGSSEFGAEGEEGEVTGNVIYYHAGDGASGGGGCPWNPPPWPHTIDQSGPAGKAVRGGQGYDGDVGYGDADYGGQHTAGGGGGAGEAGNTRGQPNGGHGRPCDIAGWGPLWEEIEWRTVPWFAGGGAGKERPNLWSFADGVGGFGGGGQVDCDGISYRGGGGGGSGRLEPGHLGDAEGPAGGSGVVIFRVHSSLERRVGSLNAIITRIPEDHLHIDDPGDDEYPI